MPASIALLLSALAVSVFASPTWRNLLKRAPSPAIGTNWSPQEHQQISDAFGDALTLANNVLSTPTSVSNPIMGKYFNPSDFSLVLETFQTIVGDGTGNDLLQYITVIGDYPNLNNQLTCETSEDVAELRFSDSGSPTMILCDGALEDGGINKGYNALPFSPNSPVSAVTCDSLDPTVSWKMDTLGATVLHEYFHFMKLVNSPLPIKTRDLAYGAYNTQFELDKAEATQNPDSFAWMATELYWSVACGKTYADPTPEDSHSPLCGMSVCIRR